MLKTRWTLPTFRGLALLLLATILIRGPGLLFGVLNIDETDFFLIARRVLEGAVPYVDVVELKPPLAYVAYLPGALGSFEMWRMQLIGIAWIFATCLVLRQTALLWTGRSDAGWLAAGFGLMASCCDLPAVNAELWFNLPVAGSLFFFARAEIQKRWTDHLWSGLSIGLATLFKHQAGITLVALSFAVLLERGLPATAFAAGKTPTEPRRRSSRLAILWLGFALPWAAVVLTYWRLGHLAEFYDWNVARNFLYVGQGSGSSLGRLVSEVALRVLGATLLLWLLAAPASFRHRDAIQRALALALWLTWIPVSLSGRFYGHYFLQFAPPLALLAARRGIELRDRWQTLSAPARAALVIIPILQILGYFVGSLGFGMAGRYPAQNLQVRELAGWLAQNSSPNERIFVWGHYSPIYFMARRMPGTRYIYTSFHMGGFDSEHLPADFDAAAHRSSKDVAATLQDLETNKPELVVDTAPANIHNWSKVPLQKFPQLEEYVQKHYRLIANPAGAAVYRRRVN
jgi:hypothetical protein